MKSKKHTKLKNRRKGQTFEQHIFECPICGNIYTLFRPIGRLREKNHKKWLWCYKCKKKINFIELGNFREEI
jgi:transcription elongation factor Elf1